MFIPKILMLWTGRIKHKPDAIMHHTKDSGLCHLLSAPKSGKNIFLTLNNPLAIKRFSHAMTRVKAI
jgi:hypothetical protein